MTAYRLTRRGRMALRALPLVVLAVSATATVAQRIGADPAVAAAPSASAASSPAPSASRTAAATPRPSRTASPTPKATPKPSATARALTPTGSFAVAPGSSTVHGSGPLRRFTVEVEKGLPTPPAEFAAAVERVLFDERSWGGGGRLSFQRVSSGPVAFRVVLATPTTTDRLCLPLRTGGIFSCYMQGRSVLNAMRWYDGASAYTGDLASYRTYMVNHEVGHALGHGHRYVCGAGGLAPVMIQQTKGLRGCRRNPWPLADER